MPPFDIQRLNRGGSLFLTRPTLADHVATPQERQWRAAEVFAAVADGSLRVAVGGRYPLREARVEVKEIPGKPGSYNAVAYLRPWLQMEELTTSLRMVARIPQKA